MKRINWIVLALASGLALPALAGGVDGNAVIGGALGGAAGAAVGSAVGGRNGAIIGGAIGGATGTAIAIDGKQPREKVRVKREVIYVHDDDGGRRHYDHGRHLGQYQYRHRHRHEHRYGYKHHDDDDD